jgi:mannose-1-phosphate guanylyltransferase
MKISSKDVFIFILAGGKGTRFWPLSRKDKPKQFLKIFKGKSMLQLTYDRVIKISDKKNIFIVTCKGQLNNIKNQLPELSKKNIIIEPQARGTASAISLAASEAKKMSQNSIMAVIPADQYIYRKELFKKDMNKAIKLAARNESLIIMGIKPHFASTGYGYIEFGKKLNKTGGFQVKSFKEKPSLQLAKKYLKANKYYFNSGMFIWQTDFFLSQLSDYMPMHYRASQKYIEAKSNGAKIKIADRFYKKLDTKSIDYGLLQKSDKIMAIKASFGWSDLGSPKSLEEIDIKKTKGNIVLDAEHVGLKTKDCIIYSNNKGLIATLGLDDIVIIQSGDSTLVAKKDNLQDVRKLVNKLKNSKKNKKFS